MHPLLKTVFEKSILLGEPGSERPIRTRFSEGLSSLLVITGENASGKSIFRRALTQAARAEGLEVMHLSPEGKAKGGLIGAMVYGTEEYQSTGSNSARTLLKAMQTARARDSRHILIFDEPDAGLSDEYAAGAGIELAEFCRCLPELTILVAVISHRRALIGGLAKLNPAHISVGHEQTLAEWLLRDISPRPLSELKERDVRMFRAVSDCRNRHGTRQPVSEGQGSPHL